MINRSRVTQTNFRTKKSSELKDSEAIKHSSGQDGQSMFGTSNFGTGVTTALSCGLRHQMLTSAPSSIEMLTSAPWKRNVPKLMTCTEVRLPGPRRDYLRISMWNVPYVPSQGPWQRQWCWTFPKTFEPISCWLRFIEHVTPLGKFLTLISYHS